MFKRVVLTIAFILLVVAVAVLYVGGVASFSDRLVRFLRPGPKLSPPGTAAGVEDWELFAETEHFRYYVRPGDHIPRWAMDLAEDHLDAASHTLQIGLPEVIQYYKHPSQLDLHEATGSRSTGTVVWTEDGQYLEVHSVHRYDPHEVMHALVLEAMGEPPAMFDEGLATAFGWDWTPGERDVHQRATVLLDEGRLVPLQRLLTNWDFRSYKAYPAYTTAGSFIKYLLAEYGPQSLSRLFELDRFSQLDEIEEQFSAAYGRDIYQVEESWRTALQSRILVTASRRSPSQTSDTSLAITGIFLLAATFLGAVLFIVAGEKVADATIQRIRVLVRAAGRRLGLRPHE
jgi:hypothetical protein